MLNKSLTVVLPVHNGETRLRKSVNEILELASELTSKFGVLIIDDYGYWQGCRKAVDEYFRDSPILLTFVDDTGVVGVKR